MIRVKYNKKSEKKRKKKHVIDSSIDKDHGINSNLTKIRIRMIKLQIASSNFEIFQFKFLKFHLYPFLF